MSDFFIGIDLGGTNLRCAVIGRDRRVVGRHETPTRAHEGPDAVIGRLADGVREAARIADVDFNDIAGIGVGSPGPLDARAGIVLESPNLQWVRVPLAALLHERTGREVYLENDANAAGFGEYWAGAGQGHASMLLMTLGTGIGGAIVVDGQLRSGPDGTAGEIGHVCIADGGRRCGCGRQGCIEAYASAPSTVARFREARRLGWSSRLEDRDGLTAADIFRAATDGDNLAQHIVEETGRYLGLMAGGMANLLNPDICVFAGGMIKAGEQLFRPIREAARKAAFDVPGERMKIVPAALGEDAGLIGAAACAMIRHDARTA